MALRQSQCPCSSGIPECARHKCAVGAHLCERPSWCTLTQVSGQLLNAWHISMLTCGGLCMQIMQGEQGVVAHVRLPPRKELDQYDKLELDFTLGCPGVSHACLPRVIAIEASCSKIPPKTLNSAKSLMKQAKSCITQRHPCL